MAELLNPEPPSPVAALATGAREEIAAMPELALSDPPTPAPGPIPPGPDPDGPIPVEDPPGPVPVPPDPGDPPMRVTPGPL